MEFLKPWYYENSGLAYVGALEGKWDNPRNHNTKKGGEIHWVVRADGERYTVGWDCCWNLVPLL
jgi:hypothetical protein